MQLIVNGEMIECQEEITLLQWLQSLGKNPDTTIIEQNGQIIPRDQMDNMNLAHEDRLELFQFVGGG